MESNGTTEPIMIGAEIFIEPGQTKEEVLAWFSSLKACGMTITRIRMFESYMHLKDGSWDFTLFDRAFEAAEQFGIKIYANLFPETEFSDVGGFKFPKSKENFEAIANYIDHIVPHFANFSSLYGWVPINEPGSGVLPANVFTAEKLAEWKLNRAKPEYNSNGFTTFELAEQRFLLDYNTWFLSWLTEQIRRHDPSRPIHVNNHDIFKNASEYDFPKWRGFLTSLGGSAHASWHFGYFSRPQYALAMSANAELLRSGAGGIPWLMTELQGGNNTYSGKTPLCPTKEEIAQWLWINIASGSRGAIFWCLNPRRSGFEAGEWALLDFQDQPSDRMEAAAKVCKVIADHHELFDMCTVLDSGFNVLYTRESMWIEQALQIQGASFEGREVGGVMKSALAYFAALSEMGVNPNLKEISEYDFDKLDVTSEVIILAQQISIPSAYWQKITEFVKRGGRLLIDGMTAYYDENAYFIMGQGFPLKEAFGGMVKEFKTVDDLNDIKLDDPDITLKAHLWVGSLIPESGQPMAHFNDQVIGLRNELGKGKVVWLTALLGMGARISDDYSQLAKFLKHEYGDLIKNLPAVLSKHHSGILLKVLARGSEIVTVLVNKSKNTHSLVFSNGLLVNPEVLWSSNATVIPGQDIQLDTEGLLVIKWRIAAL
jgi:beta-galactosidase